MDTVAPPVREGWSTTMVSAIEWTDDTINPITGCKRVSPGCDNCYSIIQTHRGAAMGHAKYDGLTAHVGGRLDFNGQYRWWPQALQKAIKTRKPTIYFVNSMSDIGGEGVEDDQIREVFRVMNATPHHTYQILTKRINRILRLAPKLKWTPNIWMGVSIESDKYVGRARLLAQIPAALRFISAEPLLSDLPSLDLSGIGWLIAGGESGMSRNVRPMDPQWVRNIRDRVHGSGLPFFFKQWGTYGQDGKKRSKRDNGHLLDGIEYFEMPPIVRAAIARRDQVSIPVSAAKPRFELTIASKPPEPLEPNLDNDISPRIKYRAAILDRLRAGPMSGHELRAANQATGKNANLHSWALVDLQAQGKIKKAVDGRYKLLFRLVAEIG